MFILGKGRGTSTQCVGTSTLLSVMGSTIETKKIKEIWNTISVEGDLQEFGIMQVELLDDEKYGKACGNNTQLY